MRDTLPFLQRLGLDEDTDARSIRRAYARALKLIDQESDSAGFQELREAYDTALQWAAWREQQNATPVPATPNYGMARAPVTLAAAPPAFVADDAQSSATIVFTQFRATMAQLLQQHRAQNTIEWQRALQHSLNDERLLDLNARFHFEAQIADLLTNGWQPGHDTLFNAACKVFHWDEDRRRLQQLGHAGALLDQAIREYAVYQQLSEAEKMIHHAALALLRKDSQPTAYQLRGDMPHVERLMQLFPAWMSVVVDLGRVEQWRASLQALPPEKKSWWPKLNIDISSRLTWAPVVIFFLVLCSWMQDPPAPIHSFAQATQQAMPEYPPLPDYLRQNIADRIPTLPLALGTGQHQAELTITLDEQGKLYQMMMYRTSGSISYDEAVSKALRDSQPFPPETPRKFQVTFTAPTGSTP